MIDGVSHLFTHTRRLLEDLHGVCVEGQRADQCPDMQRVLQSALHAGFKSLDELAKQIDGLLS